MKRPVPAAPIIGSSAPRQTTSLFSATSPTLPSGQRPLISDAGRSSLSSSSSGPPPKTAKIINKSWWRWDYLLDWLTGAIIYVVYWIVRAVAKPRQSVFIAPGNPDLSYPFNDTSVPGWVVMLMTVLLPILMIIVAQVIHSLESKRTFSLHDFHHAMLGLFLSFSTTMLVVAIVKITAGTPRPNYFANPNQDTNGRESFPSGLAAAAWAGWTFTAFYLTGKIGTFHADATPAILTLLSLCPFIPAIVLCIFQYVNYFHRWEDLIGGALIGALISAVFYHSLFEELWDAYSSEPKSRNHNIYDFITGTHFRKTHIVVASSTPKSAV